MEAFAVYLFRSVIWLTGFALVYLLFLRNERFFRLKRVYLVSGILVLFEINILHGNCIPVFVCCNQKL